MRIFPILILTVFFNSCSAQAGHIIPVPSLTESYSLKHDGRITTYRTDTDYFLVKGNSVNKDSVKMYVENHLDTNLFRYDQYDMEFYKESESLNLEAIKKFTHKYKAVEDEKPIFIYTWFSGKLFVH